VILEVLGAYPANRGSALMVHAAAQEVASWSPETSLAARLDTGDRHARQTLGLKHVMRFGLTAHRRADGVLRAGSSLIPDAVLRRYDLVADRRIDGCLDVSGFRYGDGWGADRAAATYRIVKRMRRTGKPVVFLPQAFGPFSDPGLRQVFGDTIGVADLVFARDTTSLAHLHELVGETPNVRLCPDFTASVAGVIPADLAGLPEYVCIVPNYRMIDRTSPATARAYEVFLKVCIRFVHERGLHVVLVAMMRGGMPKSYDPSAWTHPALPSWRMPGRWN
jgi:hypothetical protein